MCSPSGDTNASNAHVVDVVPALHHVEAGEQIDVLLLRGRRDQFDHALGFRLGDHLGRKLRIDQHHVGAGRADLFSPAWIMAPCVDARVAADHGIGAELPEYEIGLDRDDRARRSA